MTAPPTSLADFRDRKTSIGRVTSMVDGLLAYVREHYSNRADAECLAALTGLLVGAAKIRGITLSATIASIQFGWGNPIDSVSERVAGLSPVQEQTLVELLEGGEPWQERRRNVSFRALRRRSLVVRAEQHGKLTERWLLTPAGEAAAHSIAQARRGTP